MTTKYFRGLFVFSFSALLACFLLSFTVPAVAHDNSSSHDVYRGMGDGFRALMSKDGYGRSVFTLYVNLDVTITNESRKSATDKLVEKLGTAFIVHDKFLLTNKHVADVSAIKKEYTKRIDKLYSALVPSQKVTLRFTESYKAIDSSNVTFLVSLIKMSDSIDAALFQFTKTDLSRKSFIIQNESESLFSPVAVPGSPLGITNMVAYGQMARAELADDCGDKKQGYLLFMSSVNPGNSGGPLYNLETDKVNGIVTSYLGTSEHNSMISCAVPSSLLIKFLDENLPPRK